MSDVFKAGLVCFGKKTQFDIFCGNLSLNEAPAGKIANCLPEILKIYYKIHREHQNCATEILVVRCKLSRLRRGPFKAALDNDRFLLSCWILVGQIC